MATKPEFSCIVQLSLIENGGNDTRFDLEANADQRRALAGRLGCVEINRFAVTFHIRPLRKDGHFRINGTVSAEIVQNCVVSLAPVATEIEKQFSLRLCPETGEEQHSHDVEDEEFETYAGNTIDLGEIGTIELALAIDPYPRAPGVSTTDLGPGGDDKGYEVGEEERRHPNRPFEALAALKRKG